ncbi:prohibitin family protein [Helicobacter mustelae]|uniref:Putative transmembrane protein n=1 Tax=Helicobacter mustelae (strain ATCC 43772 / CCUG 25715 / CIP 103759 / LMG 18044 / NCTC 12198 / R85-136P) TaxID=679897 RepID=D3UJ84_HELM1|nr:prohibitin family protein [Helicobacter mustelae]CBG40559.1 putative transmembrane protein [Helicobacter mustelae 12198]SQH72056.1 Cation-transporting ATPase/ Band 7 family protein [Helicobacter mustelae]
MPIDLNEHLKRKTQNNSGNEMKDELPQKGKKPGLDNQFFSKNMTLLIAAVIIIAGLFILRPFVVINSGEVGIKVTAGEYDKIPLQPGIRFFIPLIQKIIIVDTKVRVINFSSTENMGVLGKNQNIYHNEAINVMDSRGLTVSIELTVQYQLDAQNASLTLATYGQGWEQIIINPIVRDVVRNVIGRYPAEDLPTKRNEIAKLIDEGIRNDIAKRENHPVELSSVQLREIVLPPKIKEQIEKVQIARQEAERVRYEVERSKQEAEKMAALAKGEAQSNRIKAQGSADAVLIQAKANANANKAIAESLNDRLLRLREIETQGKFNEALKENKDAQIFLMPGGAVPNLWVDSKKKAASAH